MAERQDPSGRAGQPSPIELTGEGMESRPEQTAGHGTLTSGADQIAEVDYTASLIETDSPLDSVQGPVHEGHGIVTITEQDDFDAEAPELVLHMEDGRSLPIVIEAEAGEEGYRFRVVNRA